MSYDRRVSMVIINFYVNISNTRKSTLEILFFFVNIYHRLCFGNFTDFAGAHTQAFVHQ